MDGEEVLGVASSSGRAQHVAFAGSGGSTGVRGRESGSEA